MRPKPLFGEPCNNCGLCCMQERCPVSERYFGAGPGPCPALEADGTGGHVCGLLTTDRLSAAEKEATAVVIGAGYGCDAAPEGLGDMIIAAARRPAMREAVMAATYRLSPAARVVLARWRRAARRPG